jgi:hypothetical protein
LGSTNQIVEIFFFILKKKKRKRKRKGMEKSEKRTWVDAMAFLLLKKTDII